MYRNSVARYHQRRLQQNRQDDAARLTVVQFQREFDRRAVQSKMYYQQFRAKD